VKTKLLWKVGKCTYSDGKYKEAEEAFAKVVQIQKSALGADHRSTLRSIMYLASTYRRQGRWKEAEALEVQVMEQAEARSGSSRHIYQDEQSLIHIKRSRFYKQRNFINGELVQALASCSGSSTSLYYVISRYPHNMAVRGYGTQHAESRLAR
jgi:hypothetical protein